MMQEIPTPTILLDLPEEVILEILTYMNTTSLKNLRLVCSKMKGFVENPKHLQKLQMCPNDNARMEDIMCTSYVRWNNIDIPYNLCNWETERFLSIRLHHCVKRLKFTTEPKSRGSLYYFRISALEVFSILQCVGPQLQSLEICSNFAETSVYHLRETVNKKSTKRMLSQNLNGLRELHFQNMIDTSKPVIYFILSTFLKMCPNLVTLQLPITSNRDTSPGNEEMCQPLISFLTELSNRSTTRLATIDFGYIMKESSGFYYLDLPSVFPLTQTNILPIIKLCKSIGVKLCSVPISAIPTKVTQFEEQCLTQCIESVICVNEIRRLQDMPWYISQSTLIDVALSISNTHIDEPGLDLQHSVIQSINLQCDGRRKIESFTQTYRNLLQTQRPSLTKLILKGKNCIPSGDFNLFKLFPNLKTLFLTEIHDSNGDKPTLQSILDGLQHLKDLTLKGCEIHSNSLVGYDIGQLPFLKSMRLNRLKLIHCSVTFRPDLV